MARRSRHPSGTGNAPAASGFLLVGVAGSRSDGLPPKRSPTAEGLSSVFSTEESASLFHLLVSSSYSCLFSLSVIAFLVGIRAVHTKRNKREEKNEKRENALRRSGVYKCDRMARRGAPSLQ